MNTVRVCMDLSSEYEDLLIKKALNALHVHEKRVDIKKQKER
jgi:hypothetical protein